MINRITIIEIIIVLNIILFFYTGIAKIQDYNIFKAQLGTSPILSAVAKPVALLLPWVEFAIVTMLIIPRWRLKGLYASFTSIVFFTIYIIALFFVSSEMPCSCGGVIELLSWEQHIVFNTVFILLNCWAIYLHKKERKVFAERWNNSNNLSISD